jgi:hypothetical protein
MGEASRAGHSGESSIIAMPSAGAWTTSVIQNRTASDRRPQETISVIRGPGFSATSRAPAIMYGAS